MQNPSSGRADRTARSIVLGLLCSFPAVVCLRIADACVADADLGWHLRTAEWILAHRAFPHTDPFSRIAALPWQAYSWLFELILLKLWQWMNLDGFVVFTATLLILIAAAFYRLISRLQSDFTVSALLLITAMICMSRGFTPRPWLFSILFFVLEVDILMQARRTGSQRELLWLPPMFALWANLHIQFVDGLLVLGLAACEPLLIRWWKSGAGKPPARALWLTLAGCIAAPCINPYGPEIYKIAWTLGSQSGVLNTIVEMRAIPFRNLPDYVVLFLALAAAGVLFRYRQLSAFETLLLAMAAIISFRSQRDVWFIATIATAILAAGIPGRDHRPAESASARGLMLSAATAGLAVFLVALLLRVNNTRLQTNLAREMPVKAVEVVRERHYPGPVFNDYSWGGFLIWNLRQPVSIDPRAALYGDARIQRSDNTWDGGPNWASNPLLTSAGIVIGPVRDPLTQLLRTDPQFQLVWEDKVAAVFVSRGNPAGPAGSVARLDDPAAAPGPVSQP